MKIRAGFLQIRIFAGVLGAGLAVLGATAATATANTATAATAAAPATLSAKESYAQALYANPRGISCAACHGARGESRIIASYATRNKTTKQLARHNLVAPAINTITFEAFKAAFGKPHQFMPTYFLTEEEITALYQYVSRFGRKGE